MKGKTTDGRGPGTLTRVLLAQEWNVWPDSIPESFDDLPAERKELRHFLKWGSQLIQNTRHATTLLSSLLSGDGDVTDGLAMLDERLRDDTSQLVDRLHDGAAQFVDRLYNEAAQLVEWLRQQCNQLSDEVEQRTEQSNSARIRSPDTLHTCLKDRVQPLKVGYHSVHEQHDRPVHARNRVVEETPQVQQGGEELPTHNDGLPIDQQQGCEDAIVHQKLMQTREETTQWLEET
mmetsp:Transcript_17855/g.53648  ORF Transcript_17855/g.53648 Transcript_17855/m.53648 type:complete len:233 (-) Transcript_17855:184-882(-)